jgi:hypothetical protein
VSCAFFRAPPTAEMLQFIPRDRVGNSDNNLLFFAEPGNINIETKLDSFFMELKSQDQKNHELYEEYKKINLVLEMTT